MLQSMTGYGRASDTFQEKTITIEVRSLNSKYTDIRFKIPQNYKEKEGVFRKLITDIVKRGKVDVLIDVKSLKGDEDFSLNKELFKKYYRELHGLSQELDMHNVDILQAIMRIPNVVASANGTLDEEEWKAVDKIMRAALKNFTKFRVTEGQAMEDDLTLRTNNILALLKELNPREEERVKRLRQKIYNSLEEHLGKENIDENRFEQEILFYLEKIDITEEKVRLEQHCHYFLEELTKKQAIKGRKLSFISQEMGREINTLGAKAYSSSIQKIVVGMKDELEKVKEQVANCV